MNEIVERTIAVRVNGERRLVPVGTILAQLVRDLNLTGKKFAVECNGDVIPRSRLSAVRLADGDTLEIVVAVGGG